MTQKEIQQVAEIAHLAVKRAQAHADATAVVNAMTQFTCEHNWLIKDDEKNLVADFVRLMNKIQGETNQSVSMLEIMRMEPTK